MGEKKKEKKDKEKKEKKKKKEEKEKATVRSAPDGSDKKKQIYLAWWVRLHEELERNEKLRWGKNCKHRSAGQWLAPGGGGRNCD